MTRPSSSLARRAALGAACIAAALGCAPAGAAVLPDDRADLFYSKYSGGGMNITGESVLVQKKITENLAVEADYFVDKVSGASVDVLSNASVIRDERKQKTVNIEYIHDKTTYTLGFTNSTERDYISNTPHFSLSQDMFGDLTTLTLGFSSSRDKVGDNYGTADNPKIRWDGYAQSRDYTVGLSQIFTKNLIGGLTFEVITDSGYLANPYRSARYVDVDPANRKGYLLENQTYPLTRTSTAVEGRVKYYLPWRAAAGLSYRYFHDTWGITGHTAEIDYTHPIRNLWILEGRVRYYTQGHANFYSDLYPFFMSQNFTGRDKELASSNNVTIGAKATYAFLPEGWKLFKRGTATLDVSRVQIRYRDFRDIKDYQNVVPAYAAGQEPYYSFNANIFQIYISMFF